MSVRPNRRRNRGGARARLLVGLAAVLAAAPARASSLQHRLALAEARAGNPLPAYFQAALQGHRLNVRLPADINRAAIQALAHFIAEGEALPATPFIAYLRWRHDLDPARFDRFHPRIGTLLEANPPLQVAALPPPPVLLPPPILPPLIPRVGTEGLTPPPPPVIPGGPTVPEPPTAILLAMIAPAAWAVRVARKGAKGIEESVS
jgi:hypothetical protein